MLAARSIANRRKWKSETIPWYYDVKGIKELSPPVPKFIVELSRTRRPFTAGDAAMLRT